MEVLAKVDFNNILIIEDNPGDARLLSAILGGSPLVNYNVEIRFDLYGGLKALSEKKFNAILLDPGLPDSDGLETLQKIREINSGIPIIILTIDSNEQFALEAIKNGAQDFIFKGELKYSILEKSIRFAIERKKLELSAVSSENFYEKTFEQAAVGMLHLSLKGEILKINRKACEITGYIPEELIGRPISVIIHDEDQKKDNHDQFNLFLDETNAYSLEKRIIRKDGTVIWANLTGSLIKPIDVSEIIFITIEDIDLKKRLENIADFSLKNYKFLAENSPDIIIRLDKNLNVLYANPMIKSYMGKEADFYIGKNISEVAREKDFEKFGNYINDVIKSGEKDFIQETVQMINGLKTYEIVIIPEINKTGLLESVLLLARDITDRIKSEEEILRKNKLLESIIENNPIGMWITDKSRNRIHHNKILELIWGGSDYIPVDSMTEYKAWWTETGKEILSEDWPSLRALKFGEITLNEKINIKCHDGQIKTILYSAIPIFNSDDKIENVLVLNQDVTELLKMEQQLKVSLAEKEILMREIHHRVKNNLQIIMSLFNLQKDLLKNYSVEDIFTESQSRIRSMMLVHNMLYNTNVFTGIELNEYLTGLIKELQNSFSGKMNKIEFILEMNKVDVSPDYAINLGLIVNELILNAVKHGFKNKSEGKILVSVGRNNGSIQVNIKDTGDGIPEEIDFQASETLGFLIVNTLVSQLKGSIELIRDNGTEFKISFPA
jgi:PAS domain S-box-containing protein